MIKVDPYFLYEVGAAIRPLANARKEWKKSELRSYLWVASYWLDTLLNKSVYRLRTCMEHGQELLSTVHNTLNEYKTLDEAKLQEEVDWLDHYLIETNATKFQTVLAAELKWGQLYLVEPKGGYELAQLTENGISIFPRDLTSKVPEAIEDAKEAARCIAFALPTAAAFHMHRLHELVLRRYYDQASNGKPRPEKRNIGAYIDALKGIGFKDQKVYGALAGLKNFHRNPVLHPDDRLEDIEEAIALLGSINTVVTYMLKALQPSPLQLTPPPSEVPAIENQSQDANA